MVPVKFAIGDFAHTTDYLFDTGATFTECPSTKLVEVETTTEACQDDPNMVDVTTVWKHLAFYGAEHLADLKEPLPSR
jgi:hypothetical protein